MLKISFFIASIMSAILFQGMITADEGKEPEPEFEMQIDVKALLVQLKSTPVVLNDFMLPSERMPIDKSNNYKWIRPICHDICQAGVKALPVLIDFLDCDEYLYVTENGSARRLGAEASSMFEQIVDPQAAMSGYGGHITSPHISSFFYVHSIPEWWETNKDKTLYEMQQEILIWYFAEADKREWSDQNTKKVYISMLSDIQKKLPVSTNAYALPKSLSLTGTKHLKTDPGDFGRKSETVEKTSFSPYCIGEIR